MRESAVKKDERNNFKEEEFDEETEEFQGWPSSVGRKSERKSGVLSYLNPWETALLNESQLKEQQQSKYISEKQKKREKIWERLNELFVNFAEFSLEKGEFFIPYTGLNWIFKESKALSPAQLNQFSVIVKQEVNNKQGIK